MSKVECRMADTEASGTAKIISSFCLLPSTFRSSPVRCRLSTSMLQPMLGFWLDGTAFPATTASRASAQSMALLARHRQTRCSDGFVIKLAAINQVRWSLVENIKIRRCRRHDNLFATACVAIVEVRKIIPGGLGFLLHLIGPVLRIILHVVRADGHDGGAARNVVVPNLREPGANVLHVRAMIANEHHEQRLALEVGERNGFFSLTSGNRKSGAAVPRGSIVELTATMGKMCSGCGHLSSPLKDI